MSTVFKGERWSIQRFVSGFGNNAFLITCARTGKSVIVDTPANPSELIDAAAETKVEKILITHGHRDHVEGFPDVAAVFDVPVGIGAADATSLPDSISSARVFELTTNNTVTVGDISLRPMATPGHTPGSTCFMLQSTLHAEKSHVFTGDTLFPGGPGRSVSHAALKQILVSLETHIFLLPSPTVVLPGHGEFTTIGEAAQEYSEFTSRPLDPTLFGDVTWR